MNQPAPSNRRTYPLSLLFLVLTCAAVLAAVAAPMLRTLNGKDLVASLPTVIAAIFISMLCGALLGMIIGLYQFDRKAGVICGLLVGSGIGPLVGLLLTVRREHVGSLMQVVIVGSAIIVLIAWLIRPAEQPRDEEIVNAEAAPDVGPPAVKAKNYFAD